ncbi:hypothetical protein RE6C_05832 [Rhodopirellula europaea 6C]|uniref:Uncharacterized protein n=1 Tax=Rhodopirellula europaea 6C TaxID=1263867 RepID=M2AAE1_9BACT|nr:hypothetical protein RE6C_05832 [Rhodopirellula europaea 6C]
MVRHGTAISEREEDKLQSPGIAPAAHAFGHKKTRVAASAARANSFDGKLRQPPSGVHHESAQAVR